MTPPSKIEEIKRQTPKNGNWFSLESFEGCTDRHKDATKYIYLPASIFFLSLLPYSDAIDILDAILSTIFVQTVSKMAFTLYLSVIVYSYEGTISRRKSL